MPPVTSERVSGRVYSEIPAACLVMEPVVESADSHPLDRFGGGVDRRGQAQPVEVQRSHSSAGMNPK